MPEVERLGNGLTLKRRPDVLEISGWTYEHRERLKALGGKWQPDQKVWLLPIGADLTEFKPVPVPRQPKPVPTLQKVFRTWICIKKKAQLDPTNPQGPMLWVCPCHGTWRSDYTGD